VLVTAVPGQADRLAVAEQGGRVLVFANDRNAFGADVLLDLTQAGGAFEPVVSGGEEGLLGLAFDPDFAENGYFYVDYTPAAPVCSPFAGSCTQIVRFRADTVATDAGDVLLRTELGDHGAAVRAAFTTTRGGMIRFGPDGMLWIATGDGGSAGDPEIAQHTNTVLGKLRASACTAPHRTRSTRQPVRRRVRLAREIFARSAQSLAVRVRPADRRPVAGRPRRGQRGDRPDRLRRSGWAELRLAAVRRHGRLQPAPAARGRAHPPLVASPDPATARV
jgi:glucose/arabinose dehydrogenase